MNGLDRFLQMLRPQDPLQAATNPMTSPQLGMLNRMLGLAQGQAQTAIEQTPQKLAESQALLSQYEPGGRLDPRLMDQFMNLAGWGPMGITAWHGSPHLFRMFDPTKRGTGEGAQAYGVGAGYTGGERAVGESYKLQLSQNTEKIGRLPIGDYYKNLENQASKSSGQQAENLYAKMDLVERLSFGKTVPEVKKYAEEAGYSKSILNWVDKELLPKFKPSGYLYKGDIPDEILPKFLDWDKKFVDQTPEIKEAIQKYWKENKVYGDPTKLSGAGIYDSIVAHVFGNAGRLQAQEAASKELEKIGLRGIRYLDQGSRDVGKGTSNYIPFKPEDYNIQEINDIPISEYYRRGLLERPLTKTEQAYKAWEADPNNEALRQAYRQARREAYTK